MKGDKNMKATYYNGEEELTIDVYEIRQESKGCTPFDFERTITITGRLSDEKVKRTEVKMKRVIYHAPATIVYWEDGTRTVVKCDKEDEYNPMLGLALCYMKKALGNTSRELNKALRAGRV